MFTPNSVYGRMIVERCAVFDANINRISRIRFIRGGTAQKTSGDNQSLEGAVEVGDALDNESYVKQNSGLFTFFDVNSTGSLTGLNRLGQRVVSYYRPGSIVGNFPNENKVFQLEMGVM